MNSYIAKNKQLFSRLKTCLSLIIAIGLVIAYLPRDTETQVKSLHVYNTKVLGKNISTSSLLVTPSVMLSITPTQLPTPTPTSLIPQASAQTKGYCLYVPVLYYHHIEPNAEAVAKGEKALNVDNGQFEHQMAYIASHGYSTITALTLINALITHTGVPAKSILITIDDGYKDVYTNAYPILQKYHLTANLLIPTGLLEVANYISWDQLQEMKNSGLIFLIDHTWSHFSLPRGDATKIEYEISTGKQQLEQHTGQTTTIFGYPYGTFNALSIQILKKDGFIGAFSTIPGKYQCDSFIMTLHRTRIGNAPLSSYGL